MHIGPTIIPVDPARPPSLAGRAANGLHFGAHRLASAAVAARVDVAIITSITLLAAVLRIWHLGTVPLGLHGDEAWTGLDARRVLHEGWIGPYRMSALGQPIGPLYFTALLFKFFPQTTSTLRLSMALFGIATVPLAYAAFASMFNRTIAAFASLLLAVMMWHLHLSRTGFMVISWPFVEMAVLVALWHAMRLRSVGLFLLAGALTGLGVYSYNAFYLFIPIPFVAMMWTYAARRSRPSRRRSLLFVAAYTVAGLAISIPMLLYIKDNPSDYRYHQELVSVTNSEKWKNADGFGEHANVIWTRAKEWSDALIYGGRIDFGDGLATQGHPPLGRFMFALSLVGAVAALWNWRRPEYAAVVASLVLLPWGGLLTEGDGLFRRTLGLTPFIALLAALPLAWAWDRLLRLPARRRYLAVLVLIAPAYVGVTTTYQYFGPVQDNADMKYVYPYQLDAASHFMSGLPDGTFVYFLSGSWRFDYETRRFIAPKAVGVDRSREFRDLSRDPTDDPIDYTANTRTNIAFILLAPYLDDFDTVVALYPGGSPTEVSKGAEILFRAYYVPAKR